MDQKAWLVSTSLPPWSSLCREGLAQQGCPRPLGTVECPRLSRHPSSSSSRQGSRNADRVPPFQKRGRNHSLPRTFGNSTCLRSPQFGHSFSEGPWRPAPRCCPCVWRTEVGGQRSQGRHGSVFPCKPRTGAPSLGGGTVEEAAGAGQRRAPRTPSRSQGDGLGAGLPGLGKGGGGGPGQDPLGSPPTPGLSAAAASSVSPPRPGGVSRCVLFPERWKLFCSF